MIDPRRSISIVLLSAVASAIAIGCGASQSTQVDEGYQYQDRLAHTGAPALHAIHNSNLRELMQQLGQLRIQTWPVAFDERKLDDEIKLRDEFLVEMSRSAQSLALAIEDLPRIEEDLQHLEDTEKLVFSKLVGKLREQATHLSNLVQSSEGSVQAIRISLEGITATCNACHTSFRQFGPLLDGG